jgi:nitrate/TMAO reductase-like tetraheme cytochrome c subunit
MPRPELFLVSARHSWYRRLAFVLPVVLGMLLFLPGASLYYRYSGGRSCAKCHEIWQPYNDWHTSTHRNVLCSECHGNVLTLNAGFHLKNIRRLYQHLRGDVPEQVQVKNDDVEQINARCAKCHRQEYADWAAGPHAATYREIFLDQTHNRKERLADDCLRCHGMYFDGSIRDLVTRTDITGPWQLRSARLTQQPVIPCLACHQMHRQGSLLIREEVKSTIPGPMQEISTSSLALFDRRELDYVALPQLSLPAMHDGERLVKISPDVRQALCYQCHAPVAGMEVGSGDDRTAVGVHEGLSCFACHQGHGQKTRASCSTCHPRLSNCGLNVETMDTTFKSSKSPHNIHFVKCIDCHVKGIPHKNFKATIGESHIVRGAT